MPRSRSASPVRTKDETVEELPPLRDQIVAWFGGLYKDPVVGVYQVRWSKWHSKAARFLQDYDREKYKKGVWSLKGLLCFFIERTTMLEHGHVELQLLLNDYTCAVHLEVTSFCRKIERFVSQRCADRCGNFGRKLEFHLRNRIPFAWRSTNEYNNHWFVKYPNGFDTSDVRNVVSFSFSELPSINWQFYRSTVPLYCTPEEYSELQKEEAKMAMLAIETIITDHLPALARQGFVPPKLNGVSVFDKYSKDYSEWANDNPNFELVEGQLQPRRPRE